MDRKYGMGWGGTRTAVLTLGCVAISQAAWGAAKQTRSEAAPDFGPNVMVFSPSMSRASIQQQIDKVYALQQHNEFGPERNALLFLPGDYKVDVPVGFYTEVVGLGATPDAVHIAANVHRRPARRDRIDGARRTAQQREARDAVLRSRLRRRP